MLLLAFLLFVLSLLFLVGVVVVVVVIVGSFVVAVVVFDCGGGEPCDCVGLVHVVVAAAVAIAVVDVAATDEGAVVSVGVCVDVADVAAVGVNLVDGAMTSYVLAASADGVVATSSSLN